MPRYIDAENAAKKLCDFCEYKGQCETMFKGKKCLEYSFIENEPTADVAPVVHAHWIPKHQTALGLYPFECSRCGRWETLDIPTDIENIPYCHCGAKMDEKEKEQ